MAMAHLLGSPAGDVPVNDNVGSNCAGRRHPEQANSWWRPERHRSLDLAVQHGELVAKHGDPDILGVLAS
jgi:hypothetical protein